MNQQMQILICILLITILLIVFSIQYMENNVEQFYFSRRGGGRGGGRGFGGRGFGGRGFGGRGFSGRGSGRGFGGRGWRNRGFNRNRGWGGYGGYPYIYAYGTPTYYYDDYYANDVSPNDWCWEKVTLKDADLKESVTRKEWVDWATRQGLKRILFPKTGENFIMKQSITNCSSIDISKYDSVIF
jgi:hypothetical protein